MGLRSMVVVALVACLAVQFASAAEPQTSFKCDNLPGQEIAKIAKRVYAETKASARKVMGGPLVSCTMLLGQGAGTMAVTIKVHELKNASKRYEMSKRATMSNKNSHEIKGLGEKALFDGFSKSILFVKGANLVTVSGILDKPELEKVSQIVAKVLK